MRLVLFILILSSSAFAHLPLPKSLLSEVDKSKTCSSLGVSEDRIASVERIEELISELEDSATDRNRPKAYDYQLWEIRRRMGCIHRKLPKIRYNCDSKSKRCQDGSVLAWVSWVFGKVKLCDSYFGLSDSRRVSTLIHEAAHKCGAFDLEYHWASEPKRWYWGVFTTYNNADAFGYWSENGFCIPGYDC